MTTIRNREGCGSLDLGSLLDDMFAWPAPMHRITCKLRLFGVILRIAHPTYHQSCARSRQRPVPAQ